MAKPSIGRWTNPEAERRFLALEQELRAEAWPEPPDEIEVDTRFGRTLAYHWAGEGTPVVFLHGYGATSVMWAPLMRRLGQRASIALDTVGDAGRSVQTAPITTPVDLADWLAEALTALDVARAHLIGASYGGWIVLLTALHHSERVVSISLLEPIGLEKLNMARFISWGALCGLAAVSPDPIRRRAAVRLRQSLLNDKRWRRMGLTSYLRHRFRLPQPTPLTDADLAAIQVPTLLLLGEKSEVQRSARVLARAQQLIPDLDAQLVAGAGHSLPVDQADRVADRLSRFLAAHSSTGDA